jgi:hypothetical protein
MKNVLVVVLAKLNALQVLLVPEMTVTSSMLMLAPIVVLVLGFARQALLIKPNKEYLL